METKGARTEKSAVTASLGSGMRCRVADLVWPSLSVPAG